MRQGPGLWIAIDFYELDQVALQNANLAPNTHRGQLTQLAEFVDQGSGTAQPVGGFLGSEDCEVEVIVGCGHDGFTFSMFCVAQT